MDCPSCGEKGFLVESGCRSCKYGRLEAKHAKDDQKNPYNWKGRKKYFHRCDSPIDEDGNQGQCWNMIMALSEFNQGELMYCWLHRAREGEINVEPVLDADENMVPDRQKPAKSGFSHVNPREDMDFFSKSNPDAF